MGIEQLRELCLDRQSHRDRTLKLRKEEESSCPPKMRRQKPIPRSACRSDVKELNLMQSGDAAPMRPVNADELVNPLEPEISEDKAKEAKEVCEVFQKGRMVRFRDHANKFNPKNESEGLEIVDVQGDIVSVVVELHGSGRITLQALKSELIKSGIAHKWQSPLDGVSSEPSGSPVSSGVKEEQKCDEPLAQRRPLRTKIALDNDECLGNFEFLANLYQLHLYHEQYNVNGIYGDSSRDTMVKLIGKYYLSRRGARPGLKKLLQHIHGLKKAHDIDEVYMYTSARNDMGNAVGYITFLRDCLEHYAGVKGMYDQIFSKDMMKNVRTTACGA